MSYKQRVLVAMVAWWVWVMMPHAQHRLGKKPRLNPASRMLDHILLSPTLCAANTRFTPRELRMLANSLLINPDGDIEGNWRFRPLHRLMLFLLMFGNALPSRKLSACTGWAAHAVLNNWRYHIEQIVVQQ